MLQRNSPRFLSSTRVKAATRGREGRRCLHWGSSRFPRDERDAAVMGEQLGMDVRLPGHCEVATEQRSLAVRAEATVGEHLITCKLPVELSCSQTHALAGVHWGKHKNPFTDHSLFTDHPLF